MTYKKILILPAIALIAAVAVMSCNKKVNDFERTDLYQISQLLNNDQVATSIYPAVWLDTISRAPQAPKVASGAGTITPDDYWVDVIAHSRSIPTANDSCRPDDLNQDNPCAEIQIEGNGRAHVRTAKMRDSLVCRYNIINALDHSVTTKNVTFVGNYWAMMAKLNSDNSAYRGWSLYAVGAQWQHVSMNTQAPIIDSVVLKWADQRFVTYGNPSRHRYLPLKNFPHIPPGEYIDIEVYAPGLDPDLRPQDGYIHYSVNGVMRRDVMDTYGDGVFTYDALVERSGATVGTCSQIVIEVFDPQSLRDTNAGLFGDAIIAVSYRIAE